MSKSHRGTGIRDQFNNGRAECPVCKRTAIKCLYEREIDGQKVKVIYKDDSKQTVYGIYAYESGVLASGVIGDLPDDLAANRRLTVVYQFTR